MWRLRVQFVEVLWVWLSRQFDNIQYGEALSFYPFHLWKHQLLGWNSQQDAAEHGANVVYEATKTTNVVQ